MPTRHAFLPLVIGLLLPPTGTPAQATTSEDTADVNHLIAAYHQAVLDHDGERLAAMFVPSGGAWFSVLSDEGLARVRARKADAPRVRSGGAEAFFKLVSTSKARLDPLHSDMHIQSDGAIATVTFDFRFMVDGKEQNRGAESWQLIKGDSGWRIASIVFSSTPAHP